MLIHDLSDHLTNGKRLSVTAMTVSWLEPVKAADGVVRPSLTGKEKRNPALVGKCRPARSDVIALSRLGAAVKHDDEWAVFRKSFEM